MKIKIIISLSLFCFAIPGISYGQQAQGQDKPTVAEQSPKDAASYMGGKEHYLPDSPYYMSGKKHYLPDRPIPKTEKSSQDSQASVTKEEKAPDESQNPENQERSPFQLEFRENPDNSDIF